MENRLIHNPTEKDIDINAVNFELPEFQEIAQMARDFCDKP
jgi:hypothetical protein